MSKVYVTATRNEEWCTQESNHDFRKGPVQFTGKRDLVCLRCGGVITAEFIGMSIFVPLYRADEHWSQELEDKLHWLDRG